MEETSCIISSVWASLRSHRLCKDVHMLHVDILQAAYMFYLLCFTYLKVHILTPVL